MKSLKEIVEQAYEDGEMWADEVHEKSLPFIFELDIQEGNYPTNFSNEDKSLLKGAVVGELIYNSFKSVLGIKRYLDIPHGLLDRERFREKVPRITVSLGLKLGCYLIEVSDNGPGISPENMGKIWTRGFSTFGTSGVGLPHMLEEVSDRFFGRMDVQSRPNEETKFSVYIPLNYRS